MVHIVTYDLKSPHDTDGDYHRVITAIKAEYPYWCHLEKSVWIVGADQDAGQIRDNLRKYFYDTDILFVGRLTGNWGSFNLSSDRVRWLKDRQF